MDRGNENQDIDLTQFFKKIGHGFDYLVKLFFRGIAFLIRNAIIIAILLVVGAILGFLWQRNQKQIKWADLIVYANVESSDYLGDAVELLEIKLEQKDTNFLREFNFLENNRPALNAIEVNPIINLKDILNNYNGFDNDQVVLFLENIDDKGSFFENKILSHQYNVYKIELEIPPQASNNIIENTLHYLEDNGYFQQKLKIEKQNLTLRKQANEYTLEQIDTLFINFNKSLLSSSSVELGQIEISGNNGINLNDVLQTKSQLLDTNNELEKDILRLDNLFHVINKPYVFEKVSLTNFKIILVPLIMVLVFVSYHIIKRVYRKLQPKLIKK